MPHHETFHDTHDGKKLYLQAWEPEGAKKGAILLVHGLAEHSGRYAHLAAYLNQQGFAVYSFDGRGHGKSALPKPNAYFSSMDDYLRDVDALFKKMQGYVQDVPCFLMGFSMGGGILTQYALTYRPDAKGFILSAPALLPGDDISPFLIKISKVASSLVPRLKAVKLDGSHLSHDPNVMKEYDNDPLVYRGGIPARTGAEIINMMDDIQENVQHFDYPVLIMHGTKDYLTNVDGSKMLYEKAKTKDKTLNLYEGFYHELINEVEKEKVMADIVDWLNARLA